MARKSALIIGQFTKTEHGFTGKLETLAHKGATITLQPNDDKDKDSPLAVVHRSATTAQQQARSWPPLESRWTPPAMFTSRTHPVSEFGF